MRTVWDSDDRPEDYERYGVEHPPTVMDLVIYGLVCAAFIAMVITLLFFTGP